MKPITLKRFIPFSKKEIYEFCLLDADEKDTKQLGQFYQLLSHIFHFEFYNVNEALKNSYRDKNTQHQFIDLLNGLLNKANYEKISQHDLNKALDEASLFKIKLDVDFNDFSEVLLYCREESIQHETVKTWFGLSSKKIQFVHKECFTV